MGTERGDLTAWPRYVAWSGVVVWHAVMVWLEVLDLMRNSSISSGEKTQVDTCGKCPLGDEEYVVSRAGVEQKQTCQTIGNMRPGTAP